LNTAYVTLKSSEVDFQRALRISAKWVRLESITVDLAQRLLGLFELLVERDALINAENETPTRFTVCYANPLLALLPNTYTCVLHFKQQDEF
jgi:hypothetical protein